MVNDGYASVRGIDNCAVVVEQMSGRWKIKHPDMATLAAEARQVLTGTPVAFEWIPRAENSRADKLANEAMDTRRDFRR